ncbi:MAG TPA: DUF6498-containing protein [Candidatus Dormibacteraeota bacterium]|nr:DUF6498-containing protein [Candidatus Dormibacteraeota bacterium]
MERLLAMYRVTSSTVAGVLLVIVNLVPLAGVLWWGWDLWTILVLYWVENGIVGVFNIAKIVTAQGVALPGAGCWQVNGRPASSIARGAIATFFTFHYGLFWLVHGVFVVIALPVFAGLSSDSPAGPDWGLVLYGAIGLAISHGASFALNYVGRGEYRTSSPQGLMLAPYGRVVALHMTIILGAIASSALGAPVGALVVLVTLKTALDLLFHLREHRRAAAQPIPSAA